MVADALTRTPWWVGRRPVRLLAGLAALALASALGAWSGGWPAGSAPVAVAPVPVAAASVPVGPTAGAAADAQRLAAAAPAPAGEPTAGRSTHAPRWTSTDEPTGGSHPPVVGQRAPPAARA